MDSIQELAQIIIQKYDTHTAEHIFTVAISGIDASGKGYIAKHLQDELELRDLRVANINIDPWQNPIPIRLQKENAAENFYLNVFRWREVFEHLIIPLRAKGNIRLNARLIKTDADEYYDHNFDYKEIDILIVEAIFLFQERLLPYFDMKTWINCTFETGLKRAIQRNAEKLDEQQLIHDYNTYYYSAQRFHFKKDDPLKAADFIFDNN